VTRFVDANNATEAAKTAIRMFVAVSLDFTSGIVRAHDGIGPLTWGGNTYQGVGSFGGIETVEESVEIVARPLKLTLSGVDAGLVSTTMTETYQGRAVTVYTGFINTETNALIGTPETAWEGRMNQMSLSVSAGAATITLTCEHRLRREPRIARYTDQDQQLLFSGDRFFDLIPSIKGFIAKWGDRDAAWQSVGAPVVDVANRTPGGGFRTYRE
jgi:hypothetical protein